MAWEPLCLSLSPSHCLPLFPSPLCVLHISLSPFLPIPSPTLSPTDTPNSLKAELFKWGLDESTSQTRTRKVWTPSGILALHFHCHGTSPLLFHRTTEDSHNHPQPRDKQALLCVPYSVCAHCLELHLLYQPRAWDLPSTSLLKWSRGKSGDLATHFKGRGGRRGELGLCRSPKMKCKF